jgi:hypothetical protein
MKLKKLTNAMKAKYIKTGGTICPFCEHKGISPEPLEADGDRAWSNVRCDSCRREWIDCFTLTSISEPDLEPCDEEEMLKAETK